MTIYGTSVQGKDLAPTFSAVDPQMVRVYDDLTKLAAVAKRGRPVAMSFQTWDATKVAKALTLLPTGSTLSIKHEPEDEVEASTLPLSRWREWQHLLVDAISRGSRFGQVLPATILMGWTLDPHSRRDWRDYLTPDVVSALRSVPGAIAGWDNYVGPQQGGPDGPTVTPEQVYADCFDLSDQLGLRVGIFETGVRVEPSAASKQAAWWPSAFAYAAQRNAYCFLLWNSAVSKDGVTSTFKIDDYPPLVAVWRSTMGPLFTQADLDAAVAAQKAADDAALNMALSTAHNAAAVDLQAEQARSAAALATAQATAAAHLAELAGTVDSVLASETSALRSMTKTSMLSARSQIAALLV